MDLIPIFIVKAMQHTARSFTVDSPKLQAKTGHTSRGRTNVCNINAGTGLIIGDVLEERQHDEDAAPPLRMPEGCEGGRMGDPTNPRWGKGANHRERERTTPTIGAEPGVVWASSV